MDQDSSITGTVLVIVMFVVVVGLAIGAFVMYRRRRQMQPNPNVLTGFEMVSMSSLNAPFDSTAPSKAQLLRKTSSSVILSSSAILGSSVLGLSKYRSTDPLPLLPPDQVKLLHLIAGNVFIGKFNNEKVVLKRWDCPNQAAMTSLIAAMTTIAQLEHPQLIVMHGIVRLGEFEVSAVAEYMQFGSLPRVLLKEDFALSWPDQLRMSYELASALAYMHSQPNYSRGPKCLTSRDVLVNASLSCKLDVFDFLQPHAPVATPEFTYGGAALAWEAPEVLTHNCSRNSAAEMYSLGVILGEIVTRARPYQSSIQNFGATATDIRIRDAKRDKHDLPHENRPELESCPRFFKSLVAACLSRDVLRRPLAVNVAETLQREMMLLKRNYG
ncbi:hypothetical protein DYB32_007715 [Aphanomyces invadans]|nr:hypothetical protein DYB32_007715 [Aphanomyces invadans]